MHGRPLTRVRYCLQTHAHSDHLDPSHFLSRSPEYGVPNAPRLHFYASPLESFTVGPYQVTAFPENHDPTVDPLLYAIGAGGRTIFYGIDTGPLPEETWQAFHRHKLRFDVVILDHTYGINDGASDHLNARQFIEHVVRMREENLLADDARVFAHHLSHEYNPVHPELVDIAAQHGYKVAYDGLIV